MVYYRLDKEISIEKLINDIKKLLNQTPNLESKVLVLSIQKIVDYAGDSPMPKITYDKDCIT